MEVQVPKSVKDMARRFEDSQRTEVKRSLEMEMERLRMAGLVSGWRSPFHKSSPKSLLPGPRRRREQELEESEESDEPEELEESEETDEPEGLEESEDSDEPEELEESEESDEPEELEELEEFEEPDEPNCAYKVEEPAEIEGLDAWSTCSTTSQVQESEGSATVALSEDGSQTEEVFTFRLREWSKQRPLCGSLEAHMTQLEEFASTGLPETLEERVRTRAYFLYMDGCRDEKRNYFQALFTELQLIAPDV